MRATLTPVIARNPHPEVSAQAGRGRSPLPCTAACALINAVMRETVPAHHPKVH
ncbi:unnamed protein product [[Actinomadura] parvosata subsp. kistnae]|nr:unnamed protein product [Actinomadura parvosata subsp. kistnae]